MNVCPRCGEEGWLVYHNAVKGDVYEHFCHVERGTVVWNGYDHYIEAR